MQTDVDAVAEYALRLGDDSLILGQRLCEWSGHAPVLEEDIAIANVGLDYLGRARMALQYVGRLQDTDEDQLAYFRDTTEFKNLLIVELPNTDFAFSQVRHFLLDSFEALFFAELESSTDQTLAAIASKTLKEVAYHKRRSAEWMRRFGLGTAESNERAQAALEALWGYTGELFEMDDLEQSLLSCGIAVDRSALRSAWEDEVSALLEEAGLCVPVADWNVSGGRHGTHTEHLGHLLATMQHLQRAHPGLQW